MRWSAAWRDPLSRRVALVGVLGTATLLLAGVRTLAEPAPRLLDVVLAALLLVPALTVERPLRLGGRRLQVAGLIEVATLLVLARAPGPWVVLLLGAVLLARDLHQRRGLQRVVVNQAVLAVPLSAALVLLHALHPGAALDPRTWPALAVAVVLGNVLNEVLLALVLVGPAPRALLRHLGADVRTSAAMLGLSLGLGLAVLAGIAGRRWELLVVLPVAVALLLRGQGRRLSRDTTADVLPRLALAAQRLDGQDDDELVREVLLRTAEMFDLQRTQLVLLDWPGTGDCTHTLGPDGQVRRTAGRGTGEDDRHVVARSLVAGSLPVVFGELRLTFPSLPRVSAEEEQVLATLASTCASALARSRSHLEQAQAARRDALTGLGNRLDLSERLQRLLPDLLDAHVAPAPPDPPGLALLLLDLDHFKEVNDTLGHSAGDLVLVELARRLLGAVRPEDTVVRLGGDEFAVLLVDVAGPRQAQLLAEAVLSRINRPVVVGGLDLPVEASVGVALAPWDGTDGDDLLRRADVAMYRAKDKRNAVVVYDAGMDSGSEQRLTLLGQLQAALRRDELVVHYQPVVGLADGRVLGAEALVRWQHPEQGLLMPGAFVPSVERTALVVPLTLAVLDQAVREAVQWPSPGGQELSLAVNLSPRCLLDRTLPQQVVKVLVAHGLPARRLQLEITETLVLQELDVVEDVLTSLRDLGVRLSMDDFGTGYSSMSALRRLAVHEVKVDRSFVAEAPTSRGARAIVHATVALAHGLGLQVVGEGVETPRQLDVLRASGCDAAQGFLLGRPAPAEVFRQQLLAPQQPLPTARVRDRA